MYKPCTCQVSVIGSIIASTVLYAPSHCGHNYTHMHHLLNVHSPVN